MYVKDGQEYTLRQLKADNPNVSFPKEIPEATLAEFGVYPLVVVPLDDYDPTTHKPDTPVIQEVGGVWQKTIPIVPKTQDELDAELVQWRSTASVSMASCRRVLLASGLLDTVNTAMASAPQEAQIQWEYEVNVRRTDPLVTSMQAALSLTDAQVDDLFKQGMAL